MLLRVLASALACLFIGTVATAAPLEAYGRLPAIEEATISPDGKHLALISTLGEDRSIVIRDLGSGRRSIVRIGDQKVRELEWADSRRLLITTSSTGRIQGVLTPRAEWRMLVSYDVDESKFRHLLKDAAGGLNVVTGPPMVRTLNGEAVVFVQGVKFDSSGRGRIALYRVDLKSGKSKVVEEGHADTRSWLVDQDGLPMAQSAFETSSGRWAIRVPDGRKWRELKSGQAIMPGYLMGAGRSKGAILVAEHKGDDGGVREVGADGVWSEPLFDIGDGPIRDPATHLLIGHTALQGDESRYTFYDARDRAAWRAVTAAFPGDRVGLRSTSSDRRKLIVVVDSATLGPAYALVDLDTKKASWLGGVYPDLKEPDIALVQPVKFKAADGLELSGYVTLPQGRPARNLPLVVLPHGGPAARDTPGFDWWAQALASRGYAVLQVNFRGSDGFGWSFLSAGFGQWGRKMQTDLSDGVRHLAATGIVDPKRVCIVGASYGGYAALAGATLDREVYRCSASVAGLSDLSKFIGWSKSQYGAAAPRYWSNFMGVTGARDDTLDGLSPALLASEVTAPILLIHGRDDTVVPFEQSKFMADALTRAGKSVELVSLPGEDHWLSRGETRLQMLSATVAFLEKHNPPN